MDILLPQPHQTQINVLNSQSRFVVLMCGRRWGKSLISQTIAIRDALAGNSVAYLTPTYLLSKVFYIDMLKLIPSSIVKANGMDFQIDFATGGKIRFFTGTRLDNFRGLKFNKVILDEASYIPHLEDGWLNSIRPTLTDYQGSAIFLSTPRGKNFFYSLYLKGKSGEPDWESFKYSTYDNPHILKSEIDDARIQLPMPVFEQEYMANPMENASNPFGITHIHNCIKPMSNEEPMYYGIDLAKSVDWTVIVGLDKNGDVCYYNRFQKDWKHTREEILSLNKRKAVYIDSTGVGDSITEDLQREFSNMTGFKYSAQTKQQLMELLAQQIHQGKVGFPKCEITDELEIFEYIFTTTGVRYGAPSGFHDDCVNALALAVKCMDANKARGVYHFI